MQILVEYAKVFAIGGALCVIGQLLIDRTNLTPGRILVSFVTAGVILSAIGLYQPIADFAGAGASVPLTGFGHALAEGVREGVKEKGLLGAFTGGGNCRRGHLRLPLRTFGKAKGENVILYKVTKIP